MSVSDAAARRRAGLLPRPGQPGLPPPAARCCAGSTSGPPRDWRALAASDFFRDLLAAGKVCGTEDSPPTPVDAALGGGAATRRIPFVSHPYEWSYAMLRDAALLHLEILRAALAAGFTTKDGSAYNVQWHGAARSSSTSARSSRSATASPGPATGSSARPLLYPLLLQAHLGLDFQPWLRARVDGIEPDQMRRLFAGARRLARRRAHPRAPARRHAGPQLRRQHQRRPRPAARRRILPRAGRWPPYAG